MTNDIDPIEEIHRIRREMYAEAGGTPAAFVRYLRDLEKKRAKKPAKHAVPATSRGSSKRRAVLA